MIGSTLIESRVNVVKGLVREMNLIVGQLPDSECALMDSRMDELTILANAIAVITDNDFK